MAETTVDIKDTTPKNSDRNLANYPFSEGKFGIPLNELQTPFNGRIKTGSGRKIDCDIGDNGKKSVGKN